MLHYYKIKKLMYYDDICVEGTPDYIIKDEQDTQTTETTVTWNNLDKYTKLIESITGWPVSQSKKYKQIGISWDRVIKEHNKPNLRLRIIIEYIEETPSFEALLKYPNWQLAYQYIKENIKNI